MISLIKVKCPHCSAEGQIMAPPPGAIIIGPCPECQELVVVFCGRVLPLDREVMLKGNRDQRKEHLYDVLKGFLHERVNRLFENGDDIPFDDSREEAAGTPDFGYLDGMTDVEGLSGEEEGLLPQPAQHALNAETSISDEELQAFLAVDLKLIDNRDYFKAVFE
jgi:hypothetical protein